MVAKAINGMPTTRAREWAQTQVVYALEGLERVFIFTQDTLEPVGFLPNFGGHHDCVIVPTRVEQLKNSRCTTL